MASKTTVKAWLHLFLVGAIALGIFFRLVNLDRKVYWMDETFTSLWLSGYAQTEVIAQLYDHPPVTAEALQKYQSISPEKTVADTIAQLEPQHPPFYYALARLWNQYFGDSTLSIRRFSATISILTLPCLYWLYRELFGANAVPSIAIALFAISPFHLLYAQEARQYSLWTMTIVLSSLFLLRALRLQTHISWILYAFSIALCLYTSVNSILLVIGYGLYILLRESFRLNKTVVSGLFASAAGVIAYSPWLIRLNKIDAAGWTGQDFGVLRLAGKWSANGVRLFFDVISFDGNTPIGQLLVLAPVGLVLLFLIGYATYYLIRHTSQAVWLFILTLILTTFLGLALPDLVMGGRRSGVTRYMIPSLLGIQLSVAYLFDRKVFSLPYARRGPYAARSKFWQATLVATLLAGILSCAVASPAETWWNKGNSEGIIQSSFIINQQPNQLIISDAEVIHVLSLSHRIDANARLLLLNRPYNWPYRFDERVNLSDFDNIYLFRPSPELRSAFGQQMTDYAIEALDPISQSTLWKIVPIATPVYDR